VTFFGVLSRLDGCVFCCEAQCAGLPTPVPVFDAEGRRVFSMNRGQFLIVVEGAPGLSGLLPGSSLMPAPPSNRTDLWIQNTRPMGNGSVTVCDTGSIAMGGGGVPGINPPTFDPFNSFVTNALNDFACRFEALTSSTACTQTNATGDSRTVNPMTTTQFCDIVSATATFEPGEHVLSVQLRDIGGNLGPTAQIVVRVATPTPTP
jgi:hypothetical protein